MSLLMFESFDCYFSGTLTAYTPWTFSGSAAIRASGRRGTSCLNCPGYHTGRYAAYDVGSEQSGLVVGFAMNPTSYATANTYLMQFQDSSGTIQFILDVTAAGRVRVKDGIAGNVLAESADGAITFNIYQYFEIKFTCDGSDTVQVRVDGIDVIASTSGLNLQQAGAGGVQKIWWSGTSSSLSVTTSYDDLYVCNLSGAKFTDFLGDVKVDVFFPTADGIYAEFTPDTGVNHYAVIDDNGNLADDHYIEEDTVGGKDSFTLTPTGDLPTVHAISLRSLSKNPDTGVAEGTPFVRMNETDYDQDTFNRGDTILYDDIILTARPDTGGVWTKTVLEGIEFGWEFSAAS